MGSDVEDFYGCYLLVCENPRYKGRTYIGYTRDPNRRIRQHNTGKHAGGAWKTSGRGPWAMVLTIHGFPNDIAALRFEWAWQHPDKSRRLRTLAAKQRSETAFEYRLRVVANMLRTGPWCRLPLTVRWLIQEYVKDFPASLQPPVHMAMAYGRVKAVNKLTQKPRDAEAGDQSETAQETCAVCRGDVTADADDSLRCLHRCGATSHILCLARHFLRRENVTSSQSIVTSHILPVEGSCPRCDREVLWGDLIRYKKGCYQQLTQDDGDHWADELASQVT